MKFSTATIIMFIGISLNAQDYAEINDAFKESYTYETNGEYSRAVEQMKMVYQEDNYAINLRLGWLNYLNGQFTESIAFYQKAIGLKPYAIEPRFGIVYPASALGNWNQVKEQYTKILEVDPQNSTANYRMSSIHYGNEDYQEALKYIEKVINLYPFDYDSMILYGWVNLKLGKYREAEVAFKQALNYKPGDESALEGLSAIK
jgi:tetratricopeptide (TPR) repeat protein